jgi:hypothetical protein
MEGAMAVRDFFGGLMSVGLMLVKIVLCLLFVIYDRMIEALVRRDLSEKQEQRPRVPALSGR